MLRFQSSDSGDLSSEVGSRCLGCRIIPRLVGSRVVVPGRAGRSRGSQGAAIGPGLVTRVWGVDEEPVLIDAPEVLALEIRECGEALVDAEAAGLRVAAAHPRVGNQAETVFWCRESVLDRLLTANAALPSGVDLVLAEGHRPLELQRHYWETNLQKVRDGNPTQSKEEAVAETAKYVAPDWIVPPHSTGGAVDVVLYRGEVELEMGCELNERCEEMQTASNVVDPEAKENRMTLAEAMSEAGLVNYGHEWWHYSYGDRYWAFVTDAEAAIYGGL